MSTLIVNTITDLAGNPLSSGFAAGTLMLFQQTSAPTGWTKQTTHNDQALRVVSGTASSGGSTAFTSVFTSRTPGGTVGATTLITSQIPSHAHGYSRGGNSVLSITNQFMPSANFNATISTNAEGGSGSHNHGFTGTAMDFAVQYVDLIIASKT